MVATPIHGASFASEAQQNRAPRLDPISKVRIPRLGGKAARHRGPSRPRQHDARTCIRRLLPCTTLPTPAAGAHPPT